MKCVRVMCCLARTKKMVELGQLQSALQTLEKQEKEIRKTLARYASV